MKTQDDKPDKFPIQQSGSVEEPQEPLSSILDTAGFQPHEKFDTATVEESVQAAKNLPPATPYDAWVADPSKENLYNVTCSMQPVIGSVLATMGGAGNPQLEAKARVVTAKAIKSYDPSKGASLPTWVSQQLRQMTRDVRKANSPMPIPDSIHLDAYNIYLASSTLEDELDREPTVEEIADKAHLSVKRIEKVRKAMRHVGGEAGKEPGTSAVTATEGADFTADALDYVYKDSDLNDKRILEMIVGYGGHDVMSNAEAMKELGLTPVQMSRRKARLMMRIKKVIGNLEAVQ